MLDQRASCIVVVFDGMMFAWFGFSLHPGDKEAERSWRFGDLRASPVWLPRLARTCNRCIVAVFDGMILLGLAFPATR
jgi:hypothetical protein